MSIFQYWVYSHNNPAIKQAELTATRLHFIK